MNHTPPIPLPIEVKESGIHNRGVFATRNIKKGEFIIEYTGEKISKEEGDRRVDATNKAHRENPQHAFTYIFELDENWDLDGDTPENTAKYINHSCNPNCTFSITDARIMISAARDIAAGEELSYNYGFDLDEEYEEYICRCGASNCVGYMIAEEDWPELERLRAKKTANP